jgi:hypothetical protein
MCGHDRELHPRAARDEGQSAAGSSPRLKPLHSLVSLAWRHHLRFLDDSAPHPESAFNSTTSFGVP